MSIFAPLCVHIHNKAKGGQSLNTCTIWTNIDNTDNRHTLKKLQARARYGQRGQPNTDTPAVWRRRGRPAAVLLPRVQRSPFRWTYHPPRPFRAAGGQSLNTPPPAAYELHRPDMDKYRQRGQPPNIEEITSPRPIWTTWTTESRHARRCVSIFAPLCVHILNSSARRVKKSSTRRGIVSFSWWGERAGSAPRRLFVRVNVLRPKQAAP